MYKLKYLLLVSIFLFACRSKKEITKTESYKETVNTKTLDSVIVKNKFVKPDPIKFQMELDLNKTDLFKQLFSEQRPAVITDSTGQASVYTWIDKDNKLKQKVVIKPKDILTSDTTHIRNTEKITDKQSNKETKEIITKEPPSLGFFGKIWAFIKNVFWYIVIGASLIVGYKLWTFFNIGDIIKTIFNK